ncbi:MAG: putative replicase [Cressdnaviricota sp.]|nr:MAG: putative replicase [Cressdnaviricota sp.]
MSNTFYKLRITLSTSDQSDRDCSGVRRLCLNLKKKYKIKLSSFGIENINNKGQTVPEHIHFHFELVDDLHDNPHRNVKRWIQTQMPSLKGLAIWSFPPPEECSDIHRFLRYPLKIKSDPTLFECPEYLDFDYATEEILAKNEYADVVKKQQAYAEKQECKTTLYDQMSSLITLDLSQNPQPISVSLIFNKMVDFYVNQKKPVNPQTLNGYVILYLISNNHITSQTYTALNCSNTNLPIIHNAIPQTKSTTQAPTP